MYRPLVRVGVLAGAIFTAGCNSSFIATDAPIQLHDVDRVAALNTELGIGYLRDGRNELAFKRLSKAISIQPDYSGAHNAMALLYERLGQVEKSEEHFQEAVRHNPSDSAALNNYGSLLCRQGRVDEALARFDQALTNPLNDIPEAALANAGICLQRNGAPQKAEDYLRRALARNARLPSALLAMSELSMELGREYPARGYLQRYLEVGQHTSKSLWLGIRIERELGDKNAESSYAMLLKANYPDAPETQLLLESEYQ